MEIKRRTFLAGTSGTLLGLLGIDPRPTVVRADRAVIRRGRLTTSVCPFCAVGCGVIVTASADKVLSVQGDPDHPINLGSLCPKGTAMVQVANNPRRLKKIKYRAAGSTKWEEKDWDWAVGRIAQRIKQTRDSSFQTTDPQGRVVNRTEAIACLGGAALNNEECYAFGKLMRALGVVYLEHQARVCHGPTVAGLAASFGRGAMTNHWIDLANADRILVIGSNPAENHPIAMKWIGKAQRNGAKLISVDPRFTRTSAVADLYAPLRPGTDIAFIGGLINHAIGGGLIHKEYLTTHTNAALLVDPDFEFNAGRFGPIQDGSYTARHWGFQREADGTIRKDDSLQDPACVFQLLKRHFARYTFEKVSQICGTPVAKLEEVAKTFCETCKPGRSGTLLYAMGATQHTHGTQNIRAYAILQLLLGNIGVAGGGINALRGHSNVQGSTDHGLLFDLLPGYLKSPTADERSLADHLNGKADDYPAHVVSLLKAYWGKHATADNQFAYEYLPKRSGDCSHIAMFEAMNRGSIRGMIVLGQNPAVSGPNAGLERQALEKLDWLVVADLWETETATFWRRPGAKPQDIKTEVFLLPVADSMQKQGSVTNSGRWAQWRYAAVPASGEVRGDLWILDRLARELKKLHAAGGAFPRPIVELAWDYGHGDRPDPQSVAREINGRFLADVEVPELGKKFRRGDPVPASSLLRADGTTASGNWLYCGSFADSGNQMARRQRSSPEADPLGLQPNWSWSWPANRRILYNRAGCNGKGEPWAPEKPVVSYDWSTGRWTGDLPDGDCPPPIKPDGTINPLGRRAFIMLPDGQARLYAPSLADGPFPEHYEPLESPVANRMSPERINPLVRLSGSDQLGTPDRFPIVATTFRMAEHCMGGAMSRNLPWLVELVPNAFVEISKELAKRKGIANGDNVTVSTARDRISLPALVTGRLKPLVLGDQQVEQVAIVWHFGYEGLATGPSANRLTAHVADPDAMIPEYKAFLCDVQREVL